jgi:hypothetical protein
MQAIETTANEKKNKEKNGSKALGSPEDFDRWQA